MSGFNWKVGKLAKPGYTLERTQSWSFGKHFPVCGKAQTAWYTEVALCLTLIGARGSNAVQEHDLLGVRTVLCVFLKPHLSLCART